MDEKNFDEIIGSLENKDGIISNNENENTVGASDSKDTANQTNTEPVESSVSADPKIIAPINDKVIDEPSKEELIEDIPTPEPPCLYRWNYKEQYEHDNAKKKERRGNGVAYAVILAATFVISLAILFGSVILGDYLDTSPENSPIEYSDRLDLTGLYNYCLPSYVAISTSTQSGTGAGSGIIITSDGYIATNYHVVENAKKIYVILSNGKKHEAELIDGDSMNDIAVVKINAHGLTQAKLGSSKNCSVGERVMAIGTPHNISYSGSMTSGYISGVNRQFAVKNDNGTVNKILELIQTDTSVSPGNSGGPLFNMNGEVIGIVTMKIAGTSYEGLNFAIPIDGVRGMIFDIIENGKITSSSGSAKQGAALGISGHNVEADTEYIITDSLCVEVHEDEKGKYVEYSSYTTVKKAYLSDTKLLEELGYSNYTPFMSHKTGVLVKTTSEGFDSAKKLEVNDILMSANGIELETMTTLQDIIFNSQVGDIIEFEVYRNGQVIKVSVELGIANNME